jgi:hypothetical protein
VVGHCDADGRAAPHAGGAVWAPDPVCGIAARIGTSPLGPKSQSGCTGPELSSA